VSLLAPKKTGKASEKASQGEEGWKGQVRGEKESVARSLGKGQKGNQMKRVIGGSNSDTIS